MNENVQFSIFTPFKNTPQIQKKRKKKILKCKPYSKRSHHWNLQPLV